jgi:BASS family bile acid:Na+ symporter
MSLDQMIGPLVSFTLIELMFVTGLHVRLADVVGPARDGNLLLRASLANYVAVPAAAVLLLLLLDADPLTATGILILAVCPGAPYAPPLTALAGGKTAVAVGLMMIMAGSSVLMAPLLMSLLLPLITGGADIHVDPLSMLGAILATQFLPLGCGLAINHWRPDLAARLLEPAIAVSKVLNAAMLAAILVTQLPELLEIRVSEILSMVILLGISLGIGWAAGGHRDEDRKAMALTTSIRNVGLGLAIATGAFADTPALTMVLAYGLTQLLGSSLLALWWRRDILLASVRWGGKANIYRRPPE